MPTNILLYNLVSPGWLDRMHINVDSGLFVVC